MHESTRLSIDCVDHFSAAGWRAWCHDGLAGTLPMTEVPSLGVRGVAVFVDHERRNVALVQSRDRSAETREHVMLDLVLPRLIARDGHGVLHGASVVADGQTICLVAPSGLGKSTLAAALQADGHVLTGDDATILDLHHGAVMARSLYPSLRLFSDSLEALLPLGTESTPMADYTSKRRIAVTPGPEVLPLAAVFRLRGNARTRVIRAERLSPAMALIALLQNSFALDAADRAEAAQRFALFSAVSRILPVFDLFYPRRFDALPAVTATIKSTVGRLRTGDAFP